MEVCQRWFPRTWSEDILSVRGKYNRRVRKEITARTSSSAGKFQKILIVLLLFSHVQPHGPQPARLPCSSPSPGACSNSCPWSWWCHPTISSSVVPFSPALDLSQHQGLFQWAALHIRGPNYWSFSVSISPCSEFRVDLLVWSCSPGDSRVFSGITVWKHQFFGAQPSLWSNSHIRTWLLLLQKV